MVYPWQKGMADGATRTSSMLRKQLSWRQSGGILIVEIVVNAVEELLVAGDVVDPLVLGVVGTLAEVPEDVEVSDVVIFVVGGTVLEVSGIVALVGTVVLVVARVAGNLQSVADTTPLLGCLVDPGGITKTWPILSLSQSMPGFICMKDGNGTPKLSAIVIQ